MKIPDGLEVDGDLKVGEDLKRWVVQLLKGPYGIKQGLRIWALKLNLVLTDIGFNCTDCNYLVYVYKHSDIHIMMPIHVNNLLLASNSKSTLQHVKVELSSHFKLHDLGLVTLILGMKLECNHVA